MKVHYCDSCGKRTYAWFLFENPVFRNEQMRIDPPKDCMRFIHPYEICQDCMKKINAIRMTNPNTNDISKELNKND